MTSPEQEVEITEPSAPEPTGRGDDGGAFCPDAPLIATEQSAHGYGLDDRLLCDRHQPAVSEQHHSQPSSCSSILRVDDAVEHDHSRTDSIFRFGPDAQCCARSSRGDEESFLNTAWTMQVLRGTTLWIICLLMSRPFAAFYGQPQLRIMVPVIGLALVIIVSIPAVWPPWPATWPCGSSRSWSCRFRWCNWYSRSFGLSLTARCGP